MSASLSDLATPPSPASPLAIPNTTNTSLQKINGQFISNSVKVSPLISNGTNGSNSTISIPPSLDKSKTLVNGLPILSDHMDMARPPHENPEYVHHTQIININRPVSQTQQQPQVQQMQQPAPRRVISSASGVNTGPGTIIIPQSHLQQQIQQQQPMFQRVVQHQPIGTDSTNALPIAIPVTSFAFTAKNATVSNMFII